MPATRQRDVVAVIEHGYALDAGEAARNAELAALHHEVFGPRLGSYAMTYRFDPATGALAPDLASLAAVGASHEPAAILGPLREVGLRHPEVLRVFYGGLNVATMTQRLDEVSLADDVVRSLWSVYEPHGIADFLAVCATNLDGHGILLASPLDEATRLPPATRRLWCAVAAHLAAGVRLRNALGGASPLEGAEAVVEPDGRVAHAEGPATQASARGVLREATLAMDRARTREGRADAERAVGAWRALVDGRWSLLDHFDTDGRRFVVARENEPVAVAPRRLSLRERQVVGYAVAGHANKLIAYELGLSEGTVATLLSRAMGKLGVADRAALASLHATADGADWVASGALGDDRLHVASAGAVTPPDDLTPAEREIAAALVAGTTTAELAAARGVSTSTLGNQLSSIFKKLGVSSRAELVARLTS